MEDQKVMDEVMDENIYEEGASTEEVAIEEGRGSTAKVIGTVAVGGLAVGALGYAGLKVGGFIAKKAVGGLAKGFSWLDSKLNPPEVVTAEESAASAEGVEFTTEPPEEIEEVATEK